MVRRAGTRWLALLAGMLMLPGTALATPTIGGFSARPLAVDGKPEQRAFFSLEADAGSTLDLRLLVVNGSKQTLRLHVDPVDGATGATSGTVYRNRTDPVRKAGGWLRPGKDVLRLAPGDRRTLRVQVAVPGDATPGDHVGAVALQRVIPARSSGTFAVRQVLRVAVAVQIRVRGAARAGVQVAAAPRLDALPGTQIPAVILPLHNTGQLLCKPQVRVDLTRDGVVLGTVTRQLDTVLPGDRIEYPLAWARPLEAGRYRLLAEVTGCGSPDRTSSEATLATALRGTTTAPGPDAGVAPPAGVPWWAFLLALPAAAGGGYVVAWWRRRQPRRAAEVAPAEPAGALRAQVIEPAREPAAGS